MEITDAVEALTAVASESRLVVMRLLMRSGPEGLAAGELSQRLGIPPNALTFHLTRLRHAGLVTARRNGRHIIYAASYEGMSRLIGFLTENCCRDSKQGCSPACPPQPRLVRRSRDQPKEAEA